MEKKEIYTDRKSDVILNHASNLSDGSVGQLVHHFDPDWNISTNNWWIHEIWFRHSWLTEFEL